MVIWAVVYLRVVHKSTGVPIDIDPTWYWTTGPRCRLTSSPICRPPRVHTNFKHSCAKTFANFILKTPGIFFVDIIHLIVKISIFFARLIVVIYFAQLERENLHFLFKKIARINFLARLIIFHFAQLVNGGVNAAKDNILAPTLSPT